MKTQIGNGPLEVGIVGISRNGELSIEILEELARRTLSIYPLGKIFSVSYIEKTETSSDTSLSLAEAVGEFIARKIKSEKKLDFVGVIRKNKLSVCYPDILYSNSNYGVLAHELGHLLGLKHPFINCSPACGLEKKCSGVKYLMGCGPYNSRKMRFSREDIKKLEGWFNING